VTSPSSPLLPPPYLPAHTSRSLRGTHAPSSLLDYRGTGAGTRTNSTGRFLPRDLGRMAAEDDGGAGIDWESLAEATSGAVGSLVSTTLFYPLDTCKSKFQAELQSQQGAAHKYRCGSFPPFLHSLPLAGWLSRAAARTGCSIVDRGSVRFRIREFLTFTSDRLEFSELSSIWLRYRSLESGYFLFYLSSNCPRGIRMRVSQASFLLSTCLTEERVTDALLGFNQLWTQFAESCKDVNCKFSYRFTRASFSMVACFSL
jgi:hypothetical protein